MLAMSVFAKIVLILNRNYKVANVVSNKHAACHKIAAKKVIVVLPEKYVNVRIAVIYKRNHAHVVTKTRAVSQRDVALFKNAVLWEIAANQDKFANVKIALLILNRKLVTVNHMDASTKIYVAEQLNAASQATAVNLAKYANAKIALDTIKYIKKNPVVKLRDAATF